MDINVFIQFMPVWNKRWFCVDGDQLFYFKNVKQSEPSGSVDLGCIVSVRKFESGERGAARYSLSLVTCDSYVLFKLPVSLVFQFSNSNWRTKFFLKSRK